MHQIIPTILVPTFDEFKNQVHKFESLSPYLQIDVMDGVFVNSKSFEDIEKINELETKLKFELHLMVNDPIAEIEKWKNIKNIFAAVFHVEPVSDLQKCIDVIKGLGWKTGMAINPNTTLAKVLPYLDQIDTLLFMTVTPGHQGNPFETKVLDKIKEFTKLQMPHRPICAVDGGVTTATISSLVQAGVEVFYVGSALVKAPDARKAFSELESQIV